MKRSQSQFTNVLFVLSLVAASFAVPAPADAQTLINVNVDGVVRSGLVGPAGGLGDTWNTTGASTFFMDDLLDSTGAATTVDFTTDTGSQGNNGWGSPALTMLSSAYFQFGHADPYNLVISDLSAGQRYDLYIASYYANETGSLGTFTTTNVVSNGTTQIADNGGGGGNASTWVQGTNYVLFESVQPDLSNDITIGIVGDPTHRAMLSGFQLVGLLTNPAYWVGGNTTSWDASAPTNFSNTPAGTAPTMLALPPTSGYDVLFDDVTANLDTTLDTDFDVNCLIFTSGASSSVGIAQGTAGSLTIGSAGVTVDPGSGAHTISAPVILGASQTWKVNSDNANPLTVSGQISGTGMALTKAGTGTLVLSGPNTYTGATTVNAGALTVSAGTVVQLDVPAGGTANLNATAGALNVTGGTVNVGSGATAGTATLSGGTVNAGTNALAITGSLEDSRKNQFVWTPGAGSAFLASGDNLRNADVARTLTLTGGTLTLSSVAGLTVTDGLTAWFDASQLALGNGEAVTTWDDLSGNSHTATNSGATGTPVMATEQVNGLPAVQFRGATLNAGGTMFAKEHYYVFRSAPENATWSNYGAVLGHQNDDRASGYLFGNGATNFWPDQNPDAVSKNGTPLSSGNFDMGTINEYMVLKIDVNNGNTSPVGYQIGGQNNSWLANLDIAEIITYDRMLNSEEEAAVGGYLTGKYGIATTYEPLGSGGDFSTTSFAVTANSELALPEADCTLGTVTLVGGSQLTLSGATKVSVVGLTGNGSVAGTVIIPSGGTVSPGESIGTITTTGLTLDSGSFLTFNIDTGSNDQVNVTGTDGLTIDGGGITLLDSTGAGTFSDEGTYSLIGYVDSFAGSLGNLYVANKVSGKKYTFDTNLAGDFITLAIAEAGYWNGAGDTANWNGPVANWHNIPPVTGDTVVFATAGSAGAELDNDIVNGSYASLQFESGAPAFTLNGLGVTLTGDLGVIIVNNSTATQTVNMPIALGVDGVIDAAAGNVVVGGDISGDHSLTKTGPGTLTLSGANNTYNGTIINGGAVVIDNTSGPTTLGATGSNLTLGGGSLDLGGSSQAIGALSVTAAGTISNGDLTGTSYDISNASGEAVISANLLESGGIGLTKSGDGAATLSGTNTYTGLTNVSAGTLKLGSADALQPNQNVTVDGTLDLNGNSTTINVLNGAGTITGGDTVPLLLTVGGSSNSTFSGAIEDGGGSGGGTATNTYQLGEQDSGTTIANGAVLQTPWIAMGTLPVGSILQSVSIAARLDTEGGGDTWASDLSAYVDATTTPPSGSAILQVGGYDAIGGPVVKLGWGNGDSGAIGATVTGTKNAGNWSAAGDIDLNAVGLFLGNGGWSEESWSGTVSVSYLVPMVPSTSPVSLDKVGGGELTLSGTDSTYTGKTSVREGTLYVRAPLTNAGIPGPLGAPTGDDAIIDLYNGVTLRLGNSNPRTDFSTGRTINLAGDGEGTVTIRVNDNDTNFTFGAVTATGSGAKTLDLYTGADGNGEREAITFNGPIGDTADDSLSFRVTFGVQAGAANYVNLPAVNTFTGPITLVRGNNRPIGYLTIGGVRTRNSNTPGSGQLGGGNYEGNISIDTGQTLDYYSSADQVLSGEISGPGTIRHSGTGTLTLSGTNSAKILATSGQLNLNSTAGNSSLSLNGGTVVVGPGASVGTGNFTNATGVLDTTNPLTITSSANLAGAMVTSVGPGFTVSGEVLNPDAENHRIITAQGGTLTVILGTSAPIGGTFAAGASYDSGADAWTVTGDPGQNGPESDRSAWRYTEITAGDFDYAVHVTGGLGDWRRGGLMVRDGLTNSSSTNTAAVWLSDNTCYSTRVDGTFDYQQSVGGGNGWMRLTRTGNTIKGYYSSNGTDYTEYFSKDYTTWGANTYMGLDIWYGSNMSVTFDNTTFFASGINCDLSTNDIVTTDDTALILPQNGAKLGNLSLKGGTLNVTNSVTLATDSTYRWEFDGVTADKVDIVGSLAFDGGWTLELAGTKPDPGVSYDLFTFTGGCTNYSDPATIILPEGWLEPAFTKDGTSISMMFGLMGDANGDYVVDAADFIILKQHMGMTSGAQWWQGDFDGSGTVDWTDLQTLMGNFGAVGATSAAAPEPATLGLLAIGALAIIRRRRRA